MDRIYFDGIETEIREKHTNTHTLTWVAMPKVVKSEKSGNVWNQQKISVPLSLDNARRNKSHETKASKSIKYAHTPKNTVEWRKQKNSQFRVVQGQKAKETL